MAMERSQIQNPATIKYVDLIVACVKKHLGDCQIYLFGSRAENKDRDGSDVDIALDLNKKINFKTIVQINDELVMSKLPVFVDIIDIHEASPQLRDQIKKHGILWKS